MRIAPVGNKVFAIPDPTPEKIGSILFPIA